MTSNTAIKNAAKQSMRGRFLLCTVAACIPMFAVVAGELLIELPLYFGAGAVLFLPLLLGMLAFFCVPMFLGAMRFFWLLSRKENVNPGAVFYFFKRFSDYSRCISVMVPILLRSIGIGVAVFLPSMVVSTFASADYYAELGTEAPDFLPLIEIFGIVLAVAGAVLWGVYLLRHYMKPFLLIAAPDMINEEITFHSERIYKRTAHRTLRFVLSFWPWILLSLLVFPLVFTLPYFISSWVAYCRYSVAEYNAEAKLNGNRPIYLSTIEEENCCEENRI